MIRRVINSIRSWLTKPPAPVMTAAQQRFHAAMEAAREIRFERAAQKIERAVHLADLRNRAMAGARPVSSALTESAADSQSLNENFAGDYWMNGWTNLLDMYRDGFANAYPITSAQDRRYGSNWPYWVSESQLAILRAQSRLLYTVQPNATGLLNGMANYVVGTGNKYQATVKGDTAQLKKSEKKKRRKVAVAVQEVIDRFVKRNNYGLVEREGFVRWRRDGDMFLRLFDEGKGDATVRFVEPDQVYQRPNTPLNTYSYGIKTPNGDVCKPEAYWVSYVAPSATRTNTEFVVTDGQSVGGEEVPVAEMCHLKANVDDNVKRGGPDFTYDTYDLLSNSSKLRRALGVSASVQACFAAIRQHSGPDAAAVQEFVDSETEFESAPLDLTTAGGGGPGTPTSRAYPGMFVDMPEGMQFVPPPGASNTSAHIEVAQFLVRNAGARHNAPEWLGTADASNSNYSSSLVAESPFVKTCEAHQVCMGVAHVKAIEFALDTAAKAGLLEANWRESVEVQVTYPRITPRDRQADAVENETYHEMKLKSKETISAEIGLDYDREQANLAEEAEADKKAGLDQQDGNMPPDEEGGDQDAPNLDGLFGESVLGRAVRGALLEDGFTGVIRDSLGRKVHFRNGKRVKGDRNKGEKSKRKSRAGLMASRALRGGLRAVKRFDRAVLKSNVAGRVLRGSGIALEHLLMKGMKKSQHLAGSIAKERGWTPEQAEALQRKLFLADFAGGYAGAAIGASVAGMIGAKVGSFVPTASVLCCAYQTVKAPRAALRAMAKSAKGEVVGAAMRPVMMARVATGLVARLFGRRKTETTEGAGYHRRAMSNPRLVNALIKMTDAAKDPAWAEAVYAALLDARPGKPYLAAKLAKKVLRKFPRLRGSALTEAYKAVTSSNVQDYDDDSDVLKIRFKSNPTRSYTYPSQGKDAKRKFKRAASKGKWVWKHLRRKKVGFVKHEEGDE